MKKEIFLAKDGEMNYEVFSPEREEKNLPMIVYLHGAGERGRKIEHLARHAIPKAIEEGMELNAIVLCPQCPADCVWDNLPHDLKRLIEKVAVKYSVDEKRISVTGSSMGGFGTWMLGLTYPNDFSAIAPVSGGGMEWRARNLKDLPIRAYHGGIDEVVPSVRSRLMVDAVNACGGNAELIIFEKLGHNDAINYVYTNTDIIDWLLSKVKTNNGCVQEVCSDLFD